jgi:hypothetical protein
MPRNESLYNEIAKGIADAITDIREKVVEEPWFGRVVTEDRVTELNWGWPPLSEKQPECAEKEHEHEHDIDAGMDR